MKISLIHPSRGRAHKSKETVNRWIERSGIDDLEILISIDKDDDHISYESYHNIPFCGGACKRKGNTLYGLINPNRSAVDAINNAAAQASGDIFIVVSDDTDCPENWAVDLLRHVEGKTDWIGKCSDGIQPWIITMPVMDRVYYERFGYIYHPSYAHMFCDTELACVADLTGRRIEIPLEFKHMHYSVTHETPDSVSRKADATWKQGESVFLSRLRNNFDLTNPPGKISDQTYINWAKGKL